MPKNTTINLRVDSKVKEQAVEILSSLGLTLSEAFNLMLHQIKIVNGLPFEVKQRLPVELNDGYGSYVCECGHVHGYKNFNFEAVEKEINDPDTKVYDNVDDMWNDINAESEDA
ncbi:MAG: type II toxin-antitoxin system RelB/DinJ family antitoxin [Oscillospiraceae bacterium]|nr:type II toxin-antitoxin system RelB/DinJ family antitoxin [Oscillospiraceae bacterium]